MSWPTPKRRVRAVLFDLDGTLYDSAPDLAASANRLRERDGLPPLPWTDYRPYASSGARGMLQVAFGLTPDHARFAALRADFIADYADHLLDHGRAFDGVLPLLDALQRAGLPWAVVTNKAERLTTPIVAHHTWLQTAGAVVCGDSTPHTKPHPAPVQLAAQRLGVDAADCVMVGDDLRDVQAGLAAGARTVAVRYGYLGTAQPIEAWGAHAIADAPHDILPWLELP
jgi:2-phosphoglycolate phosphatase